MSRSLSWIDPAELSHILVRAGVVAAPRGRALPRGPSIGLVRARPAPAAADREPAPPQGRTLDARLSALMARVARETSCRSMFVADAEGLVLVEHGSDTDLVAISASFIESMRRLQASIGTESRGSLCLDLGTGGVLHLEQAESRLGRYLLGFVCTEAVRRAVARALRSELEAIMSDES